MLYTQQLYMHMNNQMLTYLLTKQLRNNDLLPI